LFKIADELEIDLEDNEIQRVHRLGQKRRNNENPRPVIARFVSHIKRNEFHTNKRELKNIEGRHIKRNEFHTNKRELKNIEGRQSLFVKISHLVRHKLLEYMQKSCSDTFISCYTRNGNIKAKLKTSQK